MAERQLVLALMAEAVEAVEADDAASAQGDDFAVDGAPFLLVGEGGFLGGAGGGIKAE